MKKIYKAALAAPVVFMAFFSSCSKDETAKPKAESFLGVSANSEGGVYNMEGILAFSDTTSFLKAIHDNSEKSEAEIRAWESGLGFSSLRSAYTYYEGQEFNPPSEALEVDDEYFASVLNMDRMVAVHDWVFKVDLKNEEVSVINKEETDLISKLKSGEPDARIKVFSTDDEVFIELYNGNLPGGRVAGCSDASAIHRKADSEGPSYSTTKPPGVTCSQTQFTMEPKMKHVYQKAGIYFSLVQQIKFMHKRTSQSTPFWIQQPNDLVAELGWGYQKRCGTFHNFQTQTFTTSFLDQDGYIIEKRWCESTTALRRFRLTSTFRWRNLDRPQTSTNCFEPIVPVGAQRSTILPEISSNW